MEHRNVNYQNVEYISNVKLQDFRKVPSKRKLDLIKYIWFLNQQGKTPVEIADIIKMPDRTRNAKYTPQKRNEEVNRLIDLANSVLNSQGLLSIVYKEEKLTPGSSSRNKARDKASRLMRQVAINRAKATQQGMKGRKN